MSVFWHEYVHFWHNISTMSGFLSLAFTHHVLNAVSVAVDAAGGLQLHDLGDVGLPLTPPERDHLAGMYSIQEWLDGQPHPPGYDPHRDRVQGAVIVRTERRTVTLRGGRAQDARLVVRVTLEREGQRRDEEMYLGSLALEEAAALLAQGVVDERERTTTSWHVPELPYHLAFRLFHDVVGAEPTPYQCFAIATHALMYRFPGPTYGDLLLLVRQGVDAGLSVEDAVENTLRRRDDWIRDVEEVVLGHDLPDLIATHAGRGLLETAIMEYDGMFRAAIARRKADPAFDAKRFFKTAALEASISGHLAEFPMCDILQERHDNSAFPRDLLAGPAPRTESPFRAFQSIQHLAAYLARHVAGEHRSPACPFYHACNLRFRTADPGRCQARPWQWASERETCWYGVGASALRGKINLTKVEG